MPQRASRVAPQRLGKHTFRDSVRNSWIMLELNLHFLQLGLKTFH